MGVVSVDGAVRSLDHEIEHEGLRFGEDGYDVRAFRLKGKMEASEVDRGEHGWGVGSGEGGKSHNQAMSPGT